MAQAGFEDFTPEEFEIYNNSLVEQGFGPNEEFSSPAGVEGPESFTPEELSVYNASLTEQGFEPYKPPQQEAPQPVETDDGNAFIDLPLAAAAGTSSLVGNTAWLLDKMTKKSAQQKAFDKEYGFEKYDLLGGYDILGAIQTGTHDVSKYLKSGMSEEAKQAAQKVNAADWGWDTIKEAAKNPRFVGNLIAESIPSLIPIGASARAAKAASLVAGGTNKAAATAAGTAALISEAIVEGQAAGSEEERYAMDAMLQMTPQQLSVTAGDYLAYRESGLNNEEAISEIASNSGVTALSIAAAISLLAGKLTGASKIEASFFTGEGLGKNIAEKLLVYPREIMQEVLQEGGSEFGGNVGENIFYNPETGLMEGVGKAATLGAIGAVGQTAGMQATSGLINKVGEKIAGPSVEGTTAPPVSPEDNTSIYTPIHDSLGGLAVELKQAVEENDADTANQILQYAYTSGRYTNKDLGLLQTIFKPEAVETGAAPAAVGEAVDNEAATDALLKEAADKEALESTPQTYYRGVGTGAAINGPITWVSKDKTLSEGYAARREDGSIEEVAFSPTNTVSFDNDKRTMAPSEFFANAAKQSSVRNKSVLPIRKAFIERFGSGQLPITDFWKDPDSGAQTSELLQALGFDSVSIKEDGVETLGILESPQPTASEELDGVITQAPEATPINEAANLTPKIAEWNSGAAQAEIEGNRKVMGKEGGIKPQTKAVRAVQADIVHSLLANLISEMAISGIEISPDLMAEAETLVQNPMASAVRPRISMKTVREGGRTLFSNSKNTTMNNITSFLTTAKSVRERMISEYSLGVKTTPVPAQEVSQDETIEPAQEAPQNKPVESAKEENVVSDINVAEYGLAAAQEQFAAQPLDTQTQALADAIINELENVIAAVKSGVTIADALVNTPDALHDAVVEAHNAARGVLVNVKPVPQTGKVVKKTPRLAQPGVDSRLAAANKGVRSTYNRVRQLKQVISGVKTPTSVELANKAKELMGLTDVEVGNLFNAIVSGQGYDELTVKAKKAYTPLVDRYVAEVNNPISISQRASNISKAATQKAKDAGKDTRGAGANNEQIKYLAKDGAMAALKKKLASKGRAFNEQVEEAISEYLSGAGTLAPLKKLLDKMAFGEDAAAGVVTALNELKKVATNQKATKKTQTANAEKLSPEALQALEDETSEGLSVNYRQGAIVDPNTVDGFVPRAAGDSSNVVTDSFYDEGQVNKTREKELTEKASAQYAKDSGKVVKKVAPKPVNKEMTAEEFLASINEDTGELGNDPFIDSGVSAEEMQGQESGFDVFDNDESSGSFLGSTNNKLYNFVDGVNPTTIAGAIKLGMDNSAAVVAGRESAASVVRRGLGVGNKVSLKTLLEVVAGRLHPTDPQLSSIQILLKTPAIQAGTTNIFSGEIESEPSANSAKGIVGGYYEISSDEITVNTEILFNHTPNTILHTVIHESWHTAVHAAVRTDSQAALELEGVMHEVTDKLQSMVNDGGPQAIPAEAILRAYGFTNLHEFISEAMSNAKFQAVLATMQVAGTENKGFLYAIDAFMNVIRKYLGRLGLPVVPVNALEATVLLASKIANENSTDAMAQEQATMGENIPTPQFLDNVNTYIDSTEFGKYVPKATAREYIDNMAKEGIISETEKAALSLQVSNTLSLDSVASQREQRYIGAIALQQITSATLSAYNKVAEGAKLIKPTYLPKLNQTNAVRLASNVDPALGVAVKAIHEGFTPIENNASVVDKLKAGNNVTKKVGMGWMTLDAIETEWKHLFEGLYDRNVEKVKQFGKGFNPMRAYIRELFKEQAEARKLERLADPIATAWARFEQKNSKEVVKTFRDFVEATTLAGVHADQSFDAPINKAARDNRTKGKTNRLTHAKLRKIWLALPKDAQEVYVQARDFYANVIKQQRELVIKNMLEIHGVDKTGGLVDLILNANTIEQLHAVPAPIVIRDGKAVSMPSWDKVLGTFDQLTKLANANGPYFPIKRFGNYVVEYNKNQFKTGYTSKKAAMSAGREIRAESLGAVKTSGYRELNGVWGFDAKVYGFSLYESQTEANSVALQMEAAGYKVSGPVEKANWAAESPTDIGLVLRNATAKFDADKNPADARALTAIRESLIQLLPETSMQKSMLKRDGIAGAGNSATGMDSRRIFAGYAQSAGWNLASLRHRKAISDYYNLLMNAGQEAARNGNSFNKDSILRISQVSNELALRRTQGGIKIGKFGEYTAKAGFAGMLLSLSYSIINSTQPLLMTLPHLSGKFGRTATVAAMSRAYVTVGGDTIHSIVGSWGGAKAFVGTVDLNELVDTIIANLEKNGKPEYAAMIRELADTGKIDTTFALEISEAAKGEGSTLLGRGFNSIIEAGRVLPFTVELLNRATTAIAAYDLAVNKANASHDSAVAYASEAVVKTQFDYSTLNRPRHFVHNDLTRAMTMFKIHPLSVYTALIHNTRKALGSEATTQEKKEARRYLTTFLTVHAAMAGTTGALLLEPIKIALGFVGMAFGDIGDEEDEWMTAPVVAMSRFAMDVAGMWTDDEATQRKIADGISKGIPGYFGVDIVSRVGLQNMLIQVSKGDNAFETFFGTAVQTVIGPILGQGDSINKAFAHAVSGGDISKSIEYMAPKGARDILRGQRYNTEGMTDWSGKVIAGPEAFTTTQIAAKFVGFGNTVESNTYIRRGHKQQIDMAFKNKRSSLKKAIVNGEYGNAFSAAARAAITKHNASLPEDLKTKYTITLDAIAQQYKRKRTAENATIGGVHYDTKEQGLKKRFNY